MSDYSQSTFFAPKDLLATGNANKIIYGSDVDAELSAISTAIATKADVNGDAIGAGTPCTEINVDNLKLDGNKIISTNTDGDIELEPDGTGVVTIASDVGIGTASPSALGLQVTKGTGVAAGVLFSNAANNWQIATGTTTNYLAFTDNQFDERLRIDASGNVGIGTTSPAEKLTVVTARSYNQSADVAISVGGTDNGFVDNGKTSAWRFNVTGNAANGQSLGFEGFVRGGTWTERLRIDGSGNLGLGVTPSAWASGKAVELAGTGLRASLFMSDSGVLALSQNYYFNGAADIYAANGFATRYYQQNGQHVWNIASSGIAGNAISFTQAMTLDASGNLGVGTQNPARTLHVNDVMRLEPRATAPSSPSAGDIFFNSSTNKLQCYDGTAWQDCF